MNWKRFSIFLVLMLLVGVFIGATAGFAAPDEVPLLAPVGTTFTYQGFITDTGSPANGSYNLTFKLYDDASAGTQVGSTVTKNAVTVEDGYFTVELDFGDWFDGTALWLEIEVQGPGDQVYTPLAPRQALNATPFALYALNIPAHDHFGQTWSGPGTGLTLAGGSTGLDASGTSYGVVGQTASTDGTGVYGEAIATSGAAYGVYGEAQSVSGAGVYGVNNASPGPLAFGVLGISNADDGQGVHGQGRVGVSGWSFDAPGAGVTGANYSATGATTGVAGYSHSNAGTGVRGEATASSGTIYGVQGTTNSIAGYDFYAGGVGMDYGTFTGSHEVKLDGSVPTEVQPGMIVSATGEAQISYAANGDVDLSSTLPTVRLAATPEDKAVFGVLVSEVTLPEDHWYVAGDSERFAGVNALGEGRVWVSDITGDIAAGDYITTSTLPGYGQRQGDDILHNYTLGKATETVDWDSVTETVDYNGKTYKVFLLAVVYTSG